MPGNQKKNKDITRLWKATKRNRALRGRVSRDEGDAKGDATKGEECVKSRKRYDNVGREWAQLHRGRVCGVEGETAMLVATAARRRRAWRQSTVRGIEMR